MQTGMQTGTHIYRSLCGMKSKVAALLLLCCISLSVQAQDLKQLFERWAGNLQGAGPLILTIFSVLGFISIGIGLYKLVHASRKNTSIAQALVYIVVGSLLLSIIAFSGILSGTSFGSNQASSGLQSLGVD